MVPPPLRSGLEIKLAQSPVSRILYPIIPYPASHYPVSTHHIISHYSVYSHPNIPYPLSSFPYANIPYPYPTISLSCIHINNNHNDTVPRIPGYRVSRIPVSRIPQ